jgi:hypothetical protein
MKAAMDSKCGCREKKSTIGYRRFRAADRLFAEHAGLDGDGFAIRAKRRFALEQMVNITIKLLQGGVDFSFYICKQ